MLNWNLSTHLTHFLRASSSRYKISAPSFITSLPFNLGEAAEEVLEEHQQPLRWREDIVLSGARVCSPLLQTHPTLRYGRDRCCPGLQERLHCGQLCQGEDQECPIHHHLPEVELNLVSSISISYLLHRSNMFELADRLVGIYKTHDCTKSVTINPGLVEALPPPPAISPGKLGRLPGSLATRTPSVSSVASSNGPSLAKRPRPPLIPSQQGEEMMETA